MTDVNFPLMLEHARRAAAAYDSSDAIRGEFGESDLAVKDLPHIKVKVFVETHESSKLQWIAVRGTANLEDIKLDAEFIMEDEKLEGVPLHKGLAVCARDVHEYVTPLLLPGYQVRLTGHSLGGAIAAILAMIFHSASDVTLDHCYTFGQPKVTN